MSTAGGVMGVPCDSPGPPYTHTATALQKHLPSEEASGGTEGSGWGKTPPHASLGGAGAVPWDTAPLLIPIPSLANCYLPLSVPPSHCSVK